MRHVPRTGEKRDAVQGLWRFTCGTRWQRRFAHFLTRGGHFRDASFHNHLAFRCGETKAATMRFRERSQNF
ncbi:MAG: hypothetical protein ACKO54_17510, partial [Alphaproteobacteria bacterium]